MEYSMLWQLSKSIHVKQLNLPLVYIKLYKYLINYLMFFFFCKVGYNNYIYIYIYHINII